MTIVLIASLFNLAAFVWLYVHTKKKIRLMLDLANLTAESRLTQTRDDINEHNWKCYAPKTTTSMLEDRIEALEEANKKPEPPVIAPVKKKASKPDKKTVLETVHEALKKGPMSLAEILVLVEARKIRLKKSTIGVYLSTDKRIESVGGKWCLLQKSHADEKAAPENTLSEENNSEDFNKTIANDSTNLPNSGE